MTCMDDGILRARLDGELPGAELANVNQHLTSCAGCNARFEKLRAETALTGDLLTTLGTAANDSAVSPGVAYAHFRSQHANPDRPRWISRLFVPRWRPAWGLAATVIIVAMFVGVNPMSTWAQRVLAMLRVQKIAVVTIEPRTLMSNGETNSRPYQLINQFIADNVVVTMDPGKPRMAANVTDAAQLTGYPIRTIESLGAPQNILVNGETAFQMNLNRDRIEALLGEVERSDIHIPESANGALIAVHIPKVAISMYGDCRTHHADNCTYLAQAPSPTVSIPPDLNMSEIAEAALELAGMDSGEAHSFCQTVDWSSTLVVPIPRNTGSYETVTVDGVEGTLITETLPQGNRYSLLWVKDGVIQSLTGHGSSSDALALAASLQ